MSIDSLRMMKDLLKANIPKYRRIADALMRAMEANGVAAGSFLPTEVALARRFKAHRLTIRRTLAHLQEAHLVTPVRAKRRRFIGSRRRESMPMIGCVGYGIGGPEGAFTSLVSMRIFEHVAAAFQEGNLIPAKIVVAPDATCLPDLARSDMLRCMLAFRRLAPQLVQGIRIPIVSLVCCHEPPLGPVLALDGIGAGQEAVQYLAATGHRRPALVNYKDAEQSAVFADCMVGYQRAMAHYRLGPPKAMSFTPADQQSPDRLAKILKRQMADAPDTDALILGTSDFAPAIMAALQRLRLAVPDRLSLLTMGGIDPETPGIRLTGLQNDYPTIARCVREYIENLLAGRIRHITRIQIKHWKLVKGDSVAIRVRSASP